MIERIGSAGFNGQSSSCVRLVYQFDMANHPQMNPLLKNGKTRCAIFLSLIGVFFSNPLIGFSAEIPSHQELFTTKKVTDFQVSPDGARMAHLAPHEGHLNLWVGTKGGSNLHLVSKETRSIQQYMWQYDSQHLLYLLDPEGGECWHLYQTDLKGFNTRDLTPFRGVQARVVAYRPLAADQLLVALNLEQRTRHDLYRLSLIDGALTMVHANAEGVIDWLADADMEPRVAIAVNQEGMYQLLRKPLGSEQWLPIHTFSISSRMPKLVSLSPDGVTVWFRVGQEDSGIGLRAMNLETKEMVALGPQSNEDVLDCLIDPVLGVPEGLALNGSQRSWYMFHEGYGGMIDFLRFDPGNLSFPSRNLQKKHWVVAYRDSGMPTIYQLFSFGQRYQVQLLGMERPELRGKNFAESKRVSFPGLDQRTLHATWTPPMSGTDLPYRGVVIRAEGGHKEPAHLAYDEETQWLAHQGMGVLTLSSSLSVASTERLGHWIVGHWVSALADDVHAGAQWLIDEGHAKPNQIFAKGAGEGAYGVLEAAIQHPEIFKGILLLNGIYDMPSFVRELPAYDRGLLSGLARRDSVTRLMEASLLNKVAPLKSNILILHGEEMTWAHPTQSTALAAALAQSGVTATRHTLPATSDGYMESEGALAYYRYLQVFFSKHALQKAP
jgi:dienelactone hydrolase